MHLALCSIRSLMFFYQYMYANEQMKRRGDYEGPLKECQHTCQRGRSCGLLRRQATRWKHEKKGLQHRSRPIDGRTTCEACKEVIRWEKKCQERRQAAEMSSLFGDGGEMDLTPSHQLNSPIQPVWEQDYLLLATSMSVLLLLYAVHQLCVLLYMLISLLFIVGSCSDEQSADAANGRRLVSPSYVSCMSDTFFLIHVFK